MTWLPRTIDGNTVSVLLGNGNGTFQAKQTFGTGNKPNSVAVADFNGDGKSDLVTADYRRQLPRACCWATATGRFRPGSPSAPEAVLAWVAVADFNSDGKSDLVTADCGSNTASVLLGNGNGTFQAKQILRHRKRALGQLRWAT